MFSSLAKHLAIYLRDSTPAVTLLPFDVTAQATAGNMFPSSDSMQEFWISNTVAFTHIHYMKKGQILLLLTLARYNLGLF